jgi:hypothetical protein
MTPIRKKKNRRDSLANALYMQEHKCTIPIIAKPF